MGFYNVRFISIADIGLTFDEVSIRVTRDVCFEGKAEAFLATPATDFDP